MREMSDDEIDQVYGGFGILSAAVGALVGGGAQLVSGAIDGDLPSPGTVMIAATLGAVSGFTGNVAGVSAAAGMRGAATLAGGASVASGIGSGTAGRITERHDRFGSAYSIQGR